MATQFHDNPENFSTLHPGTAALVRGAMKASADRGLHVRVHDLPNRTDPFDYYAPSLRDRDDFIRRYDARGYRTEIVGR